MEKLVPMSKTIIYDAEIVRSPCPPESSDEYRSGIEYAKGWDDFGGMGISCVGTWRNFGLNDTFGKDNYTVYVGDRTVMAYLLQLDKTRLVMPCPVGRKIRGRKRWFTVRPLYELAVLLLRYRNSKESYSVVGFNSKAFDDRLLLANGIPVQTTVDLLEEVRVSSGQPRQYVRGKTRKGYSLACLAAANLGYGKTGSGADAPLLWQRGQYESVLSYCIADVRMTVELWQRFTQHNGLVDPTNGNTLVPQFDCPTKQRHDTEMHYRNHHRWVTEALYG